MCITSDKPIKYKIAWKPIPIYKILMEKDGILYSPYHFDEWKLGKAYSSRLHYYESDDKFMTDEGLYSYKKDMVEIRTTKSQIKIHSIITMVTLDSWSKKWYKIGHSVYEGIIPRFSRYYIDEDGQCVSNKLKILKKCVSTQTN